MEHTRIKVNTSAAYEIIIGSGLLEKASDYIKKTIKSKSFAVVTDDNVDRLYGDKLCDNLKKSGFKVCKFVFSHGEASKCADTLMKIYSFLCANHITRSDCLIALGGGVVGDITGYAAATYLRGLDFVQIPTTLLAQVDSSVGGKTAIDLPEGKNLVGAFKQPAIVLCDTDTLKTLPEEFIIDGMGEVIKYGMIKSAQLFELLEKNSLESFESIAEEIITECVSIKRDVVEADEFDRGERMLLNFGHTLGHSIEKYYHFTGITHGKAIANGAKLITFTAEKKCITDKGVTERLMSCLKKYKLNSDNIPPLRELVDACLNDKKREGGYINIIVCKNVGISSVVKMAMDEFMKFISQE